MNPNELRRLFPHASKSLIEANRAKDSRDRPCAVVQKREDVVLNERKESGMDESCNSEYHIAVTILVSDQRDRDNDGAYTTLQDCIISAVGRLTEMDRIALRKVASRLKRRGRGNHRD
jgi:hypothetical protein